VPEVAEKDDSEVLPPSAPSDAGDPEQPPAIPDENAEQPAVPEETLEFGTAETSLPVPGVEEKDGLADLPASVPSEPVAPELPPAMPVETVAQPTVPDETWELGAAKNSLPVPEVEEKDGLPDSSDAK
jgi:hypothetical protein